ncbi:MAG: argininosuccinate lyase [Actinobacteria bacterium]|nr:argininosuccinate lyase [Actinomycetota bacterium]
MKMWGGRFSRETNPGFLEFTSSVGFDARLYPYDLACGKAWAGALRLAGVLSPAEEDDIKEALGRIDEEFRNESFEFEPADEDIHTAVERRLVEMVGPAGGKLRTGRSRNDQVATDTRLLVMDRCPVVTEGLRALQEALIARAGDTLDVVVPGHTHLQQAQPVLLAHLLLAFVYMFERDVQRVEEARGRADSMTLGSAAFAGTGVDVDRELLARELGFSRPCPNSVDGVSDRDFVCDTLYAISMVMVHLSRLSEQVVLWCSQEFGLLELDDRWATGSSIMPQKKNPDAAELIRGKSGRVIGDLVAVLTILKGLPLAYNRDLQEDKEPLFDALDTVTGCLHVMERTIDTMSLDRERARELVEGGLMTATDLADFLAEKGMEFPRAHEIVGQVVTYCLREGKGLTDLTTDELGRFSALLDSEALRWLSVEESLARRGCLGGTSPVETARQLESARRMVSGPSRHKPL